MPTALPAANVVLNSGPPIHPPFSSQPTTPPPQTHQSRSSSGLPCQVILRNLYSISYKTQWETVTTNPVTGFKDWRTESESLTEHSLLHTCVRRLMILVLVSFASPSTRHSLVRIGHCNPTIYNFLSAVQLEQSSTEGKIPSYRQGQQPPAI